MVTISRAVEKLVEDSPFIHEALSKGIVNYVALAETMKSKVEYEMKHEVKVSAIMMALRRLSENLEQNFEKKIKFDRHSDITIKSNLSCLMVKRTWETQKKVKNIYTLSEDNAGIFLTITQGPHEISILASDILEDKIETMFSKSEIEAKKTKLCGLTIFVSEDFIEIPGFFYMISRAFALQNINIIDLVSTLRELTIIVGEKDAPRSFELINLLMSKNLKK